MRVVPMNKLPLPLYNVDDPSFGFHKQLKEKVAQTNVITSRTIYSSEQFPFPYRFFSSWNAPQLCLRRDVFFTISMQIKQIRSPHAYIYIYLEDYIYLYICLWFTKTECCCESCAPQNQFASTNFACVQAKAALIFVETGIRVEY